MLGFCLQVLRYRVEELAGSAALAAVLAVPPRGEPVERLCPDATVQELRLKLWEQVLATTAQFSLARSCNSHCLGGIHQAPPHTRNGSSTARCPLNTRGNLGRRRSRLESTSFRPSAAHQSQTNGLKSRVERRRRLPSTVCSTNGTLTLRRCEDWSMSDCPTTNRTILSGVRAQIEAAITTAAPCAVLATLPTWWLRRPP